MIDFNRPIREKSSKRPARFATKYISAAGTTLYIMLVYTGATHSGDPVERFGTYCWESLGSLFENEPTVTHEFRNIYVKKETGVHSFGAALDSLDLCHGAYAGTKSPDLIRIGIFKTTYHDGVRVNHELIFPPTGA